jgi:hypothetical protein
VDAVTHMGSAGTTAEFRRTTRADAVSLLFVAHYRRLVGLAALLSQGR